MYIERERERVGRTCGGWTCSGRQRPSAKWLFRSPHTPSDHPTCTPAIDFFSRIYTPASSGVTVLYVPCSCMCLICALTVLYVPYSRPSSKWLSRSPRVHLPHTGCYRGTSLVRKRAECAALGQTGQDKPASGRCWRHFSGWEHIFGTQSEIAADSGRNVNNSKASTDSRKRAIKKKGRPGPRSRSLYGLTTRANMARTKQSRPDVGTG